MNSPPVPAEFTDGTIVWTDRWITLRARGRDEMDELLALGQTTSCTMLPEKYGDHELSPAPSTPEEIEIEEGAALNMMTAMDSDALVSPPSWPDTDVPT